MTDIEEGKITNLRMLVLDQKPLFPGGMTTLVIQRAEEINMIEDASKDSTLFGVVLSLGDKANLSLRERLEEQNRKQPLTYEYGTLARVTRFVRLPNKSIHAFVETIDVIHIDEIRSDTEFLVADVSIIKPEKQSERFLAPYDRLLRKVLSELVPQSPIFSFAADVNIANIKDPLMLLNYVASSISAPREFLQDLLETFDLKEKYEKLLSYLENEKEIITTENQIRNELFETMNKRNQEQVIRQQIKILQEKLGGMQGAPYTSGKEADIAEITKKGNEKNFPPEYREAFDKELKRLGFTDQMSPEYLLIRSYLETLLSLPFRDGNEKPKYDITHVREVLDRDHYGMKDVKDRIVEFLASRSLSMSTQGAIICLVGPPGVGKTSVGKSIAEALGRKYYRFSVGGMHDEAEIKGHRRTYVGAMPGKLIKGMIESGETDPLFLIDEIDKIGTDYKGDPAAALLEALDPEQNSHFQDLYVDIPYDLSKVLFIVTANTLETIPYALLDRMEIIELSGYTPEEKLKIAKNYLLPRLMKVNGLEGKKINFTDDALLSIAEEYSREAGVRNYEKNIDKVLRKIALSVIEDNSLDEITVDKEKIASDLGKPIFDLDDKVTASTPGTAIGLAWTSLGGDTLLIEAEAIFGHEDFKITGQLGDVMKESCNIALSTLKKEYMLRGFDPSWFKCHSIHIHIPEGATPKDGPSAGITLFVALWSMIRGITEKSDLAMTGELTLTGKVMPIGGLKEKILAARRNGIKEIIIPKRNQRDLELLDAEVKGDVVFHLVSDISEVLSIAFPNESTVRLSDEELKKKEEEWQKGLEKKNE